jgi:hypothetical protein
MKTNNTTDKNGKTINVGDYVQVINRISESVEDSGYVSKIDGKKVFLKGYVDIQLFEIVYYSDQIIVKYENSKTN